MSVSPLDLIEEISERVSLLADRVASMEATPQTEKRPWPRDGVHRSIDGHSWFVPSKSEPGAYRAVRWDTRPREGVWFTCTCPAGQTRGQMGSRHEPPCRHVLAVLRAEEADGLPKRPTPPPNISGLVD